MLQRLASVLALAVVLSSAAARAGERCEPADGDGNVMCDAGVPSDRLEPITAPQKMSQWCWAAAISMLFGYHGHPVAQERIVESIWGELVDMPAMSGAMMSDALGRAWVDEHGKRFKARVQVFDSDAGQFAVDDARVIDELRAERPLLLGTVGHAMVLTAIRYVRAADGALTIIGATVRDPWPGRGRRELEWHEMDPAYVATVDIVGGSAARPAPTKQPTQPTPPTPANAPTPRPTWTPPSSPAFAPSPSHDACAAECGRDMRVCEASAPTIEACIEDEVDACVAECVFEHGESEAACVQRWCVPGPALERDLRAACRSLRDQTVGACRDERAQCLAACE